MQQSSDSEHTPHGHQRRHTSAVLFTSGTGNARLIGYTLLAFLAVLAFCGMIAGIQWYFASSWLQSGQGKAAAGTAVDLTAYGISGDFFGGVNAIVSALAFAGLIMTLLMQRTELHQHRDELRMQRDELQLTRKVMQEQREEMGLQKKSLQQQTFENTFFAMLRLLREIQATLHLTELMQQLQQANAENTITAENYAAWYTAQATRLSHYIRTLEELFRFTDNSNVPDRQRYMRLVRAQLKPCEITMLGLHYGLQSDSRQMVALIERYALLCFLPRDHFGEQIRHLYRDTAFHEPSEP